jgi:hypothetical protein
MTNMTFQQTMSILRIFAVKKAKEFHLNYPDALH